MRSIDLRYAVPSERCRSGKAVGFMRLMLDEVILRDLAGLLRYFGRTNARILWNLVVCKASRVATISLQISATTVELGPLPRYNSDNG